MPLASSYISDLSAHTCWPVPWRAASLAASKCRLINKGDRALAARAPGLWNRSGWLTLSRLLKCSLKLYHPKLVFLSFCNLCLYVFGSMVYIIFYSFYSLTCSCHFIYSFRYWKSFLVYFFFLCKALCKPCFREVLYR